MTAPDHGANGRNGVSHRTALWQALGGVALFALGWIVSQSTSSGSFDATLKAQAAQILDLKQTLGSAIQEQTRTNKEVAEALSGLKAEVSNLKDAFHGRRGDHLDR